MRTILETQRLKLREFLEIDSENMFQLNSDPEVIRYTGDDPFSSVEEARLFIRHYDKYKKFGYGRWTILLRETNEYVGWCGLSYTVDTKETDLGFRLLKKNWNKGFATEAAENCLMYGFQQLALKKIIGRAMKDNKASIRILEKIGMTFEKKFEAHGGECLQYFSTKKNEEFN